MSCNAPPNESIKEKAHRSLDLLIEGGEKGYFELSSFLLPFKAQSND